MTSFDPQFSRREAQIMELVYRLGEATAAQIREQMADAPSNSTVRKLLEILVQKGVLRFRRDGPRYVYRPTTPRAKAMRAAVSRLIDTFFGGSAADALVAIVRNHGEALDEAALAEITELARKARREGR
ncbi:MAG: BlaI/MecI/CopY family transcriptional regulator [Planctomycetota bacterium]